jgi:hypothetical protein
VNSYNLSLIFALVAILLGVYLDQMWIGFALAIVIFVIMVFAKPKPRPAPPSAPGPQQVVIQQRPEYPKEMMDFYKRGSKRGDPLYIETVSGGPSWASKVLSSLVGVIGWGFKKVGKFIRSLF